MNFEFHKHQIPLDLGFVRFMPQFWETKWWMFNLIPFKVLKNKSSKNSALKFWKVYFRIKYQLMIVYGMKIKIYSNIKFDLLSNIKFHLLWKSRQVFLGDYISLAHCNGIISYIRIWHFHFFIYYYILFMLHLHYSPTMFIRITW